jgi:hypothetical protein
MAAFNAPRPVIGRPASPREVVAHAVRILNEAVDVRGERAARIRRMPANGRLVASGQKRRRAGKLAQAGRDSMAYVTRSRSKLRRQFTTANTKLDG